MIKIKQKGLIILRNNNYNQKNLIKQYGIRLEELQNDYLYFNINFFKLLED